MDLISLLKYLERSQWESRIIKIPKKPILSRYDLQKLIVPKGDFESRSSGSTGIPVVVQKSKLSNLWWAATNIREILWFQRNLNLSVAVIKANIEKAGMQKGWGPMLQSSGLMYYHPVEGDLQRWVEGINPHYLITYSSILETLDLSKLTQLQGIKTTGETLHFKHPLVADTYSSEEVGTIAIQCPNNSECYHVMENILVEILDDQNQPTSVGRVIVTDLTSSYLHRYDIGDYAEVGTCTCGRGLQTLKKILGRKRNMVRLPDGSKHWPRIGSRKFRDLAPIIRYQAVQTSKTQIELKLIVEKSLNMEQETQLRSLIQQELKYPFEVKITYHSKFPPGKFEEFICLLEQPPVSPIIS